MLVGRNRATPRYHLRDRIHPVPELDNVSNASLPAFAEGGDSARVYGETRSRAYANGEVLLFDLAEFRSLPSYRCRLLAAAQKRG